MSVFKSACIVGHNTMPDKYFAEKEERGSPSFTVRGGTLAEILRNPRRWRNGYVSPDSEAKEYGDLLDCLALTPFQWPKRYCVAPATYTNKDGKECKWRDDDRIEAVVKWKEANAGKAMVKDALNASVHSALKVLQADEPNWNLIQSGISQVWVAGEYQDPATGLTVPVKCLIDKAPDREDPLFGSGLADLKTTRNASPRRFARDCFDYHYAIKAAWYLDLYNEATGENRDLFWHIVQENYPPYELRSPPPQLAARWIQAGRWQYQQALSLYCRCLTSGFWPGYDAVDEWPVTEPEDWMISMDRIIHEEIQEPAEKPVEEDITP